MRVVNLEQSKQATLLGYRALNGEYITGSLRENVFQVARLSAKTLTIAFDNRRIHRP